MLFNSLHYLFFFPIVALLYFALPHRFRWVLILIASYYFYMCWRWEYALMLIFITGVDYWAALEIVRHPAGSFRRRLPLIASIIGNLGLLFFFKYFNFASDSARAVLSAAHLGVSIPQLNVLLPVGISFHTFQSVSYNVDVYRGRIRPERHLGIFALCVAYFPQLVAGPIERGGHILPQFHAKHSFDYTRIVSGLQLAAWGMFKKVVIADRLAIVVNRVFDDPTAHSPAQSVVAVLFFAFQIYCDFSGYSDIAIGSAEVLGVNLVRNFERPYLSPSIGEFWKRWHISLSSWFRDYVYIPLGGSRSSTTRWYFNLFITFLVSGLWHGAHWTFVVWGGLNGVYLIGEIVLARPAATIARRLRLDRVPGLLTALRVGLTFALTCIAWCFFRARTVGEAIAVATALPAGVAQWVTSLLHRDGSMVYTILRELGLQRNEFLVALSSILVLVVVELAQEGGSVRAWTRNQPFPIRWACYYGLLASILFFGAFNDAQQFIYFQF